MVTPSYDVVDEHVNTPGPDTKNTAKSSESFEEDLAKGYQYFSATGFLIEVT